MRALLIAMLLCAGCTCGPPMPAHDGGPDAAFDARTCSVVDTEDGLVRVGSELSFIAPRVTRAGRLRIGHQDFSVTAAELDRSQLDAVWTIEHEFGRLGSIRWEADSVLALMRRPEGTGASLVYRHVALWRPRMSERAVVQIPVYERWPYGVLGGCAPLKEQFVPTPTRLWFARGTGCLEDPEREAPHFARLHGFATDGSDVTPEEGIPLANIFYFSAYTPTFQAWSDDGVAYLVRDEGSSGVTEPDALHFERRDVNGLLVARSGPLVPGAELRGTGNVWTDVVDDAMYVHLHLANAPGGVAAYLARIDPDGRVRWSHRFEGYEANTSSWRSRVEVFEGGLVALLSRPDFGERSVVRISAEGEILVAPGELVVGTEPANGVAMTADTWGVTIMLQQVDPEAPAILRRYDWQGTLFWENVLEGTRSNGFWDFLRADGRGGAYWVTFAGLYQHFDAYGRPAAFNRQTSCGPGSRYVYETIPLERPPIDAGLDASRVRPDAWVDPLDAGVELPDAALEPVDAAPSEVDAAVEDAPAG